MNREDLFIPEKLLSIRKHYFHFTQAFVSQSIHETEHKLRDAEKGRSVSQEYADKLADFYVMAFAMKKIFEKNRQRELWFGLR